MRNFKINNLCLCGCGEITRPCTIDNKRLGYVKGAPNKYIKGHNRTWEGKKRPPISVEKKRKMREAHLGRKYNMTERGKYVLRENMRKAHSAEAREKIRKFLTGRKLPPEHVKNAMRRRPITSLELAFQKIVQDNKLPYKFVGNGAFIVDGLNPDFINVNGEKIAIEVFSRFYKEIDGGTVEEYKSERIKRLSPFGWRLFFFDETQVYPEYVLSILGGNSN